MARVEHSQAKLEGLLEGLREAITGRVRGRLNCFRAHPGRLLRRAAAGGGEKVMNCSKKGLTKAMRSGGQHHKSREPRAESREPRAESHGAAMSVPRVRRSASSRPDSQSTLAARPHALRSDSGPPVGGGSAAGAGPRCWRRPMLGIGGIAHAQTEVPTDWRPNTRGARSPATSSGCCSSARLRATRPPATSPTTTPMCRAPPPRGPYRHPELQRAVQGAWEHQHGGRARPHRDHPHCGEPWSAHLLAERRQRRPNDYADFYVATGGWNSQKPNGRVPEWQSLL